MRRDAVSITCSVGVASGFKDFTHHAGACCPAAADICFLDIRAVYRLRCHSIRLPPLTPHTSRADLKSPHKRAGQPPEYGFRRITGHHAAALVLR